MLNDESILKYFTTRWVEYQLSAQILDGLCNYINKHFIVRLLGTVKVAWANMAIARKWSRKYEANEVTLFYGNLLSIRLGY